MNDILLSKTSTIKNCLKRIKDTTKLLPESLDNNFDVQDIFILNLQRAIQASFDITNIIIKEYNLDLPVNYKSAFEILYKHNFIDENIKEKMIKMAGFRNIAVHNYETINIEILKSILKNNLQDFETFYTQILENE
jgi:uncharacterized protein YutE (UPF0331/DUF86 family)